MNFEIIKHKNSDDFDEKLENISNKKDFKVYGFAVDREGFYCALVSWKKEN